MKLFKSYSEKVPYSYTDCQNVKYTVNKKTWDKNALSCVSKGIGNVTCTYQKKVCDTKTGYNTKIYYQYRDTVTKIVSSTYYSSREKIINTVYTDYMLESELPSGYTKLPGSERIEYRYKEICGK